MEKSMDNEDGIYTSGTHDTASKRIDALAMTRSDRVSVFSDFLKQEGYFPSIDDDGDIKLKIEGKTYYVVFEEEDELYVKIIRPGFWSIDDSEERMRAERAARTATAKTKVAKVILVKDNTWASASVFSSSMENAKSIFSRLVSALQRAVQTFVEEMEE